MNNKRSTQKNPKAHKHTSLYLHTRNQGNIKLSSKMCTLPPNIESFGTEMVDLYVGKEKKPYYIHKKLLCDSIPYFQKMVSSGMKESRENSAKFPEDSVRSFEALRTWVYRGSVPPLEDTINSADIMISTNWSPRSFYTLADKFCLFDLCDEIIDHYIDTGKLLCIDSIDDIYRTTLPGSPLRRWASRNFYYVSRHWKIRQGHDIEIWPVESISYLLREHEDLMIDFLTLQRKARRHHNCYSIDPRKLPKCFFHHHGKDKACYSTKRQFTPN